MPTLFGSIMGAMGSPDPIDQMEAYADAQRDKNRAAVDPNNPTAGPPAANAAGAATTMPPDQTPNAAKSDPSMGHMIAELARRQQSEQMFNQSLGMGFGAFAQPRDREAVDRMFNTTPLDATKIGASIMAANSDQQGQDRANALGNMINDPQQGPAIANALHMPGANPAEQLAALKAAYAANPQAVSSMISQTQQPTPQMANLEQINNYVAQLGQSDPAKTQPVLQMIKNAMIAGMAGPDAQAAVGDAMAYKQRTGKDAPWVVNGNIDQRAYKQFTANEAQKESDRGDASKVLAENQNSAEVLRGDLENLRDSPGLKSILADPVKRAAAQKAVSDPTLDLPGLVANNVLTTQEAATVATLRKIGGASTATALHSLVGTGTRVTQQEVGPLKDSISTTQNLNQDYDTYVHNAINPFITKIKKTVANAYGATGNLHHMDPEYEPWLHPIYRKDGELFKEGGGADAIPDLQPLTPGKLAWAKNEVKSYPAGKDDALDSLQQEGFDVSKLRKTDPSTW